MTPAKKNIFTSLVFCSLHNPLNPTMLKGKPSSMALMFPATPPQEPLQKWLTKSGVAGFELILPIGFS
jgi:hypothetical protein